MTGAEIKAIRTNLGMTPDHLARFLGVSTVTLYRWERLQEQEAPMDYLTHSVLQQMQQGIGQYQEEKQDPKTFGQNIVDALIFGGTAWALLTLLQQVFKDKKQYKRKKK